MSKSLSITVHPSSLGGDYLTVSDAMRQVLDVVEALERAEGGGDSERRIVWRLTEAHTNSPPFTVTASAFSTDPVVSVDIEATRVAALFAEGINDLLRGADPDSIDADMAAPIRRVLKRNLNGVGQTQITIEGTPTLTVVPATAQIALSALDRLSNAEREASVALRRTEYGAVEGEVIGLIRWNDKPALTLIERLSGEKVTCVLSPKLAEELGPTHKWSEAWESGRVLIAGALHYGDDGALKRVNAESLIGLPFTDIRLADLRDVDLLRGRSVGEHIKLLRGGEVG